MITLKSVIIKSTGAVFIFLTLLGIAARSMYLQSSVDTYLHTTVYCPVGYVFVGVTLMVLFLYRKRLWLYLQRVCNRGDAICGKHSIGTLCLTLGVMALVVKCFIIFILKIDSTLSSDTLTYIRSSYELVQTGNVTTFADYCYGFSHQFWFAVFLTPATFLFGESPLYLSLYLAIVSTITTILLGLTLGHISTKLSAVVFLILMMLPSQLLLPCYITHEHAFLFFISVAVFLKWYVLPMCTTKLLRVCMEFSVICLLVSSSMVNATGLVAICAYILLCILNLSDRGSYYSIIRIICILVVYALCTSFCKSFQLSHSNLTKNYRDPNKVCWTLYEGSNYETKGSWSKSDRDTYYFTYPKGTEQITLDEFHMTLLKNRYKELLSSPSQIVQILRAKIIRMWGCFDYPFPFVSLWGTSEFAKSPILYAILKVVPIVESFVFLILLALLLIYQRVLDKRHSLFFFVVWFLAGVTILLAMTECNNKYTIALQVFLAFTISHHLITRPTSQDVLVG